MRAVGLVKKAWKRGERATACSREPSAPGGASPKTSA